MKDTLRLLLARAWALALRCRARPHHPGAGPALILAPHADDETLGCGGLIALRCRRQLPVSVAFLTDSAGTSPDPQQREALARARRREALQALDSLGVPAAQVHFLGAPDGQLPRLEETGRARLTAALVHVIRQLRPGEIYLPFGGSHSTEHEAAHRHILDAIGNSGWSGTAWEYPVWAWWNPFRFAARTLRKPRPVFLPLRGLLPAKRRALAFHASQHLPGSLLPPILSRLCLGPWEFYFPRPTAAPGNSRIPFLAGLLYTIRPAFLAAFLKHLLRIHRFEFTAGGLAFWIDPCSHFGQKLLRQGTYEPDTTRKLSTLLPHCSCFVDLGANEGYFSVLASTLMGDRGRVFSIEPQSRLQEVIARNMALNRAAHGTLIRCAVSNRAGTAALHLHPDVNTGASALQSRTRYSVPTEQVPVTTLDEIFSRHGIQQCDLLKIDIEGGEYEAILGSPELFRSGRIGAVFLELHTALLQARGLDPAAILSFLARCGYTTQDGELFLFHPAPASSPPTP
jgi:FkbM family methyltransferase